LISNTFTSWSTSVLSTSDSLFRFIFLANNSSKIGYCVYLSKIQNERKFQKSNLGRTSSVVYIDIIYISWKWLFLENESRHMWRPGEECDFRFQKTWINGIFVYVIEFLKGMLLCSCRDQGRIKCVLHQKTL